MVTRRLFTLFVVGLAIQRLAEMRLSRRNERLILAQGGQEHAAEHFGVMKALHATWLAAMLAEVWLLRRRFSSRLAGLALALMLAGQALRYAAIRALGPRWTVRVMTLPEAPPVTGGIYRWLRHPNYLGVMLEILAAPLLHGAYLTAVAYSLANAALLRVRIRAEEAALREHNGYEAAFESRGYSN